MRKINKNYFTLKENSGVNVLNTTEVKKVTINNLRSNDFVSKDNSIYYKPLQETFNKNKITMTEDDYCIIENQRYILHIPFKYVK